MVDDYAPRLNNTPTAEVGSAWQAELSETRFTFERCMTVSLDVAQSQQIRLKDLHLQVIDAIYVGGATYSGR